MVKKSTVILFEKKSQKRTRQIKAGDRKAEFQPNPIADGTGPCGKLCSCKDVCKNGEV
jgi:uncharacterized FAD-dependent dehydrogenase